MSSLNAVRVAALAATVPPFPFQNQVVSYLKPFAQPSDYLHARELVSQALAELSVGTPFPNTEEAHAKCQDALASLDAHILDLIRSL
ncbi:MAG: hypothetical protein ACR2IE_16265 [Candidatus Sumerlaeaceae bacterium]